MEFVKRDITRQNRNGDIAAIGGGNSSYKSSSSVSGGGGNAASGDYLPAISNGDGTYTINLDRVFLNGNFIAKGDISALGQGILDNGNVVTVYDGLDCTDPEVALSANQGRVLKELIENIDITGVDIDLTNIYTKEETDKTFATISNLNTHTTNSNIHITDTQKSNWNSAYNLAHGHDNKSVLDGISATNVSNWNTVYTNWNNVFSTDSNGDLKVKVNVIGEKDIIAYGSSASGSGGSIDIINALNSDRTDAALSAYQGKVLKGLIDSIDVNAVDLSNYFTKDEVNTKLASKADSHTHPYASSTHTHNYAASSSEGGSANYLASHDTRHETINPDSYGSTFGCHFKSNGKNGISDGGNYYGLIHFRPYGSNSDFTGGYPHQLAFTENSNIWYRKATSNTAWGTWRKIWHSGIFDPGNYMPKSGGTFTNTVSIADGKYIRFGEGTTGVYFGNDFLSYHNADGAWNSSLLAFASDNTTVKSKLTCEKVATFTTSGSTVVVNRTGGGHPYILFQSNGTALGDFGFNASTKKPIVYDYTKSKWVDVYTETNSDSLPLSFNNATSLSAKGWYRFATATRADNSGGNCLFFITRNYNYTDNESYLVAANITYNQCTFTQLAGKAKTQLITEIRCTFENNGSMYFDLYYNGTVSNQVIVNCIGHAKTQALTATTTTLTKVNTFTLTDGMRFHHDKSLMINLVRNATSGGAYIKYCSNNQVVKGWAVGSDSSHDFVHYWNDTSTATDTVKLRLTKDGTLSSNYWILNNTSTNPYLKLVHTYNSTASTWYCQAYNGYMYLGAGSAKSFRIDTSGNCLSVGELTAYSDKRLKSDIKPLEVRGELNPVTYKKDGKDSIGFIADEVKELYPELVNTDESSDEKYLTLNYSQLTAVLYAEIKELKKQITELKERLI